MSKDRILCFGELVVDNFGSVQEGFEPKFGGAPGNTAVGLAKLGHENVFFSGKVGADFFGSFLQNVLDENNVNTAHLIKDPKHSTTLAFVSLDQNGERDFSFYSGAHDQLEHNDFRDIDMEAVRIMQFGSLTQSNFGAALATSNMIARAHQAGVYVSYDPNVRPPLWKDMDYLRQVVLDTIKLVDMVKVNEEEMEFLTGETEPEKAAEVLWSKNLQMLLITLGEKGAYWKTANDSGVEGIEPVKAIDTTGAGDAFNAGLLLQLFPHVDSGTLNMSSDQIKEAVSFANRVAAQSTQKKGAIEAIPSIDEL